MSDENAGRPPRALPVAAAPAERLEERASELARRWAAELVLQSPSAALGRISLEGLGREAPDLCRQILRAVRSDEELERLLGAEPAERGVAYADRPAALAGARDVASALRAIETLRGVIWEGLREELAGAAADRSRERLTAELSDRLAHVCAELGAAGAGRELPVATQRPPRFPERPPGPRVQPERRVVIVDERGVPPAASVPPSAAGERPVPAPVAPEAWSPERRRVDGRGPAVEAEIAIRDARGEAGPAAWIDSIGVQLERYERDALPFAVVLMEIAGAGYVEAEVERALAAELRAAGGGSVTRERDGRYWLLAPRADRIGAHALASRLERAAVSAAAAGGASATASSGTAVCPEDGTQAAALAAHADVGLYAARWESRAGEGR